VISDASQLAALQLAIDVISGRRGKLTSADAALTIQHLEAIRQRIIAAAARRSTRDGKDTQE
jgi:hypothetical protein